MIMRLFIFLFLLFSLSNLKAADLTGIPEFIDEMVTKHAFNREELVQVFKLAEHRQSVIDAFSAPSTHRSWLEYRASFVNVKRINEGLQFWQTYSEALQRAESQYGIPQETIVALIGVETLYGKHTGKYSTLDVLTTLAFDYPRRADFFRGELEQFLLLTREQGIDLTQVKGSYAGALGIPQFMPSSYRKYAVDFDGDGKIDLRHNPVDAIGSVANYFSQFGWKKEEPVTVRVNINEDSREGITGKVLTLSEWGASGVKIEPEMTDELRARLMAFTIMDKKEYWLAFENFDVITRYNNSDYYAMAVFQLAQALREAHH